MKRIGYFLNDLCALKALTNTLPYYKQRETRLNCSVK